VEASLDLQPITLEADPIALYPGTESLTLEAVGSPGELKSRVLFGGPEVVPIDSSYRKDDADMQAFVSARQEHVRFVLALMSVNFPIGTPPLATASVEVDLDDDAATGRTIAYSIFPANLGSAKDLTDTFQLQPNLTFAGVGGTLGTIGKSTTAHGNENYLIGGPELSPHPAWTFRSTKAQKIEGSTRLSMIIAMPIGRTGSLSVSLQASIVKKNRLLRFFKRQVPLAGADTAKPAVVSFLPTGLPGSPDCWLEQSEPLLPNRTGSVSEL
jgi:hypothetical protein